MRIVIALFTLCVALTSCGGTPAIYGQLGGTWRSEIGDMTIDFEAGTLTVAGQQPLSIEVLESNADSVRFQVKDVNDPITLRLNSDGTASYQPDGQQQFSLRRLTPAEQINQGLK